MYMKHVACGIMYNSQNKILMGKRHSSGPHPGIWEFPGGKLEDGESIEECLYREWIEELNLSIRIDKHLTQFLSTTEHDTMCHFFIGKIHNISDLQMNVHEIIAFYSPTEIKTLELFEGDELIANMLE